MKKIVDSRHLKLKIQFILIHNPNKFKKTPIQNWSIEVWLN